jgi:hypothetical protein
VISFALSLRISSATRTAWERYPQRTQYSIPTSSLPAIHSTSVRMNFFLCYTTPSLHAGGEAPTADGPLLERLTERRKSIH